MPVSFSQAFGLFRIAGVDIDRHHLEIRPAELLAAIRRAPAFPSCRARTRWPTGSGARSCPSSRRACAPCRRRRGRRARSSRIGLLAGASAATSPRASGRSVWASAAAGRQASGTAALRMTAPIPYIPASPAPTPASPPRRITSRRFFAKSRVSVGGHGIGTLSGHGHEQQDVGRAVFVEPRCDHGGDQRLDRRRPAPVSPGHRRKQGPCGNAGRSKASLRPTTQARSRPGWTRFCQRSSRANSSSSARWKTCT